MKKAEEQKKPVVVKNTPPDEVPTEVLAGKKPDPVPSVPRR